MRRRGLRGRFQARRPMAQPGHRVRLRAYVLPALQRVLELPAVPGPAEHDDLAAAVSGWTEPCDVELAGLAYPCGSVDRPVRSHAPPQPDVPLGRRPAAMVGEIEVTQRLVLVGAVGGRTAEVGHLS